MGAKPGSVYGNTEWITTGRQGNCRMDEMPVKGREQ